MKRLFVWVAAIVVLVGLSAPAYADAGEAENSVTGFFRRLFNYPVRASEEAAGTTARAVENSGEKILSTAGENTAAIAGGEIERTGELAAEVVTGTLETTGQAVAEVAQIPAKAAEEQAADTSAAPAIQ